MAGGTGFLGTCVARKFQSAGHHVQVASRRTGVDFREPAATEALLGRLRPRWVVNCAAHVGGIAYNALKPTEIYEDNLLIGFNLLRASVASGVEKFINVMPNCTYPGVAEVYHEPEWWDGPMHPTVLTYGMPRKALWVQGWAHHQATGFNNIHLVLPNLYGPGDHFDPVRSHALGALIARIDEAAAKGAPEVVVWGTGRPVREWMFVEDAAEGVWRAAERYDSIEILNIGSGRGCTIGELAAIIAEALGFEGRLVFDASRPDGAPQKIIDARRMEAALGWHPATHLRQGIQETVEWFRSAGRPGV